LVIWIVEPVPVQNPREQIIEFEEGFCGGTKNIPFFTWLPVNTPKISPCNECLLEPKKNSLVF
jgi:hypothetical protein